MKETRYFYAPDAPHTNALPDDEAAHAVKVLRLKPGDDIILMDGCGTYYQAEVDTVSQRACTYRIVETLPQLRQWKPWLHLAIAPTKMIDRMEWLVEKATEVGVDEITFLECQFSERRQLKLSRLERIAVSAMKQSRKAWLPVLHDITPFQQFVDTHDSGRRFIAHCYDDRPRLSLWGELSSNKASTDDILVMVGPEGDFSVREVDAAVSMGYMPADLGKSRLRTETAGLAAVMMMQLAST